MFSAFLKWRDEYNVDDIRNQILYGGLDTPLKFPNGKKIIELAPQIIISAQAKDFKGQPLGMVSCTVCVPVVIHFITLSLIANCIMQCWSSILSPPVTSSPA